MRRAVPIGLSLALGVGAGFFESPVGPVALLVFALVAGGLLWPKVPPRVASVGVTLRPSTRGLDSLGALALAFAVGASWPLRWPPFPLPWMVALACGAITGVGRVVGARLFLGALELRLTGQGALPYADIASAEPRAVGAQRYVAVMLERDERLLASMTGPERAAFQRKRAQRRRRNEPDLWLPASFFDVDAASLAAFLRATR